MGVAKKQKGHGDTSSDTAVSLKKGDFNTPSVISFFWKENGGLKLLFQNRRKGLYFVLEHENPAAETTVFLLSRWAEK